MDMQEWIKKSANLMLAAFLAVSFAGFIAASPTAATVNAISNSRFNLTAGATQNVVAGSIYQMDLSSSSSSNYWAGVWGNVSGSVQLRNAAGYDLFTLNLLNGIPKSSPTGSINSWVLAYNTNAVPNFPGLTIQTGSNIDTKTGVNGALTDSALNLFASVAPTMIIGNQTFTGGNSKAFCPVSYNASNGVKFANDCSYNEMALADGSNNLLFAMPAQTIDWAVGTKIFDNSTRANYQGVLYSNNSGTNAATTYSFFLELR